MKELELYIHIPFCKRKCSYCDFLSFPSERSAIELYVEGLKKELQLKAKDVEEYLVTSIFIGGGTPSYINGSDITDILTLIRNKYSVSDDCEISIEANPGTLSWKKLMDYKAAGVNRISIGLQSANNTLLKILGRIHSYEDFLECFELCRNAGFRNINIDLMCGIPGQSMKDHEETLTKVCSLKPEHISVYSLIIEEGTPFFEMYGEDEQRRAAGEKPMFLPSEEKERKMFVRTNQILAESGYEHYEISNYAKSGYQCRHNIGYWKRKEYLGFGLGSASLFKDSRFSNVRDMKEYLGMIHDGKWPNTSTSQLSRKESMEECMFLGMRMMEGISRRAFKEEFDIEIEGVYGDVLPGLYQEGLIAASEGVIYLTDKGVDVSNYVLSHFLID